MTGIRRVSQLGTTGESTYVDGSIQAVDIAANVITQDKLSTDIPLSGMRNVLINGDFRVWQRGTPTIGYAYSSDRWLAYQAAAVNTISRQSTSLNGFPYCARVQRNRDATNTGATYLVQAVESINGYQFQGKTATLSFYARAGANFSSSGSALTVNIETSTGTDQSYIAAWAGGVSIPSSKTLTTSWQLFTVTGVVPATANQVAVAFVYTPTGTAGAADYFEITGVQLEVGSQATPFEQRPIGVELALCQRYYQIGRLAAAGYGIIATVDSGAYGNFSFPTRMRATPTITELTKALGGSPAGYGSGTTYIDVSGFGFRYNHGGGGGGSGSGNLSFDLTWSAASEL